MSTLAELLAPKTQAERVTELLAALRAEGFRVSAWQSGGVARSLVEADAQAIASLDSAIAQVAGGGFLSTASGAWLTLLAAEFFDLTRTAAVYTEGWITLVDHGGGPHTVGVGELWVATASGKRFVNVTGGTIPLNGALQVKVRAESPGPAWDVAEGAIETLVTSLPTVTVSNWFGEVEHTGSGLATITPGPGPDVGDTTTSVRIVVTTGGGLGVAVVDVYLDGSGTPAITGYTIDADGSIETGEYTVFCDVSAGNFVAGDEYSFTRDLWISQNGRDEEDDDALRERCADRWGELGPGANASFYESKALAASDQVTRVSVEEDESEPGQVNVLIAGASGAVSAAVEAAVQAALDEVKPATDHVVVDSVTEQSIPLVGTVYHSADVADTVEGDVADAVAALAREVEIGGDPLTESTFGVSKAEIIQRIMAVDGVRNLNLTGPAGDTTLTSPQVPTFTTAGLTFAVV